MKFHAKTHFKDLLFQQPKRGNSIGRTNNLRIFAKPVFEPKTQLDVNEAVDQSKVILFPRTKVIRRFSLLHCTNLKCSLPEMLCVRYMMNHL